MKTMHLLLPILCTLLQPNRFAPLSAAPSRRFLGCRIAAVCAVLAVSGCTMLQRTAHMYSPNALPAQTFRFADGGESLYYGFETQPGQKPRALLFFYGGSGCQSWKSVMPGYVEGLGMPARVYALNKRFVSDRSTGMRCKDERFHAANFPVHWKKDYAEFIEAQTKQADVQGLPVVLVGVSEGGVPAMRAAASLPQVTHLALLGNGGYTPRRMIQTLRQRDDVSLDANAGWAAVRKDPYSLHKGWGGHPNRYWTEVMDLDPLPTLLSLNIPILVGHGEQDRNVPVESSRFLAEQFTQAGKTNLTLKVYPGADHRLQANGTSYRPAFFRELARMISAPGLSKAGVNLPTSPRGRGNRVAEH